MKKTKWIKLRDGHEKLVPIDYKEKKKTTFGAVEVMLDGQRIVRG